MKQDTQRISHLQVVAGRGELFNHVDENLPMWSGIGDRSLTKEIVFDFPFFRMPMITIGLIGIDSAHDQNLRFILEAQRVSEGGFLIVFRTWGDTHIARASVSWQAIGLTAQVQSPGRPT
ncbi:H-type lectin domain-containing protein [Mameliella alba]|nr:H-type lectin domain-containing protein [Antarctobacter heliothermus]MBY6143344.1 H-type lectin domain-containing protein [Mameliella alba]MBY6163983.1 H-type lectin domain-containing protein [Mameliella alba]MBY6172455.1 H-type lectin domain-containing protein [Mameliella alba]MBY6177469.1 H-type lectin domain-containing protein [Mameliella alba]